MDDREMIRFIGLSLTLKEHPERSEQVQAILRRQDFPFNRLVWVASSHFVLPALYARWRDAQLTEFLPADLTEYMEAVYALNLERNRLLLEQAAEVASLLAAEGIRVIFLKGVALLMDGTYPDPGERIIGDIDILLSGEDIVPAAGLLMARGYLADDSVDEVLSRRTHFPSLWNPERTAPVELHRYPVSYGLRRSLAYEELQAGLCAVSGLSGGYTCSPSANLVISFMHSQLKDRGQYLAHVSLRDLYDGYRLITKGNYSETQPALVPFRNPFNNYLALISGVFRVNDLPYQSNWRTRLYEFRVGLNQTSRFFYWANWIILFPPTQLPRYFNAIRRFLSNRKSREMLLEKLKNPAWYKSHFGKYLDKA